MAPLDSWQQRATVTATITATIKAFGKHRPSPSPSPSPLPQPPGHDGSILLFENPDKPDTCMPQLSTTVRKVPQLRPPPSPAVAVARALGTSADSTCFALGCFALCALTFTLGAAPGLLPHLFVAFAVMALPWRAYHFVRRKWTPFLVDFCYFANVATMVFLLKYPDNLYFEAMAYILANGPLAAALAAWQCAWLLGSADHAVSVLIHLLPGLALFTHRFLRPVTSQSGSELLMGLLASPAHRSERHVVLAAPRDVEGALGWLVMAPLVFYLVWQFVYWLVVQVIFRQVILCKGYDTSYNALARRAAASNNIWNKLIRSGSITRRILVYGSLQFGFTIITVLMAIPTYYSFPLAAAWQASKFAIPLWYGAQYQCKKLPEVAFLAGMRTLAGQGLVSHDLLHTPVKAVLVAPARGTAVSEAAMAPLTAPAHVPSA